MEGVCFGESPSSPRCSPPSVAEPLVTTLASLGPVLQRACSVRGGGGRMSTIAPNGDRAWLNKTSVSATTRCEPFPAKVQEIKRDHQPQGRLKSYEVPEFI